MKRAAVLIVVLALAAGLFAWWQSRLAESAPWSETELATLRSLWIASLPPVPPDPSNAVADSEQAARLGHRLFFDTRFSRNGNIACATCHQPERRFTDGLAKGRAIGTSKRNTLSIVGAAYSPWLYWDGRRDSLWAQALSPVEDPNEHGSDRHQVVELIAGDDAYRRDYEALFGRMPELTNEETINRVFANFGKAIAAYERLLLPGPSRFDRYMTALVGGIDHENILSDDEIRGLRLFIGEANCTQCHNGPLFTNHEFHNTGVISFPGEVPDKGRVQGVREVMADPFNCFGLYSDNPASVCAELTYARTGPELIGTLRTPSLRNLENTEPFMHKGQMATLAEVLDHYNDAPLAMIGHNEAKPLGLGKRQLRQLEAFLGTLSAPLATPAEWLGPPASGPDSEDNEQ